MWKEKYLMTVKHKFTLSMAVLVLLGLATVSADAAPIINSPTGLASPATTITFSEFVFAPGTPLTTQYSSLGVTFSNVFYNVAPINATGITPPLANNFAALGGPFLNPFSLMFTVPQTSAAFGFLTNPGTSTFTALLNGGVVETFTAPTSLAGGFFGFTGIAFNEIRVSAGGVNGAAAFDNVQLAPVPEPATLLLLGTGLAGVGAAVRKRRKTQQSERA